jgi:signal transduction histidine kinase
MPNESRTLQGSLTKRIVLVQVATLAALFAFLVAPLIGYLLYAGASTVPGLDPRPLYQFAVSAERDGAGQLKLGDTDWFEDLRSGWPDVWFYGQTRSGQHVALGPVPSTVVEAATQFGSLALLDLRYPTGDRRPTMLAVELGSSVGPFQVYSGNGPVLATSDWVPKLAGASAFALLIAFTSVTLLVVPRLVRKELRGITQVAAAARDVGEAGTRVPSIGLPAEVQPLVAEFNNALERIDRLRGERERFLANAAHELRTPLTVLQTRLELTPAFPERGRLLLDVRRLGSLAEQLLDLNRLDHEPGSFATIDLGELTMQVIANIAPLAISNNCELSIDVPPNPVLVDGETQSLARAVTNIVQNAIAHGAKGGSVQVVVHPEGSVVVSDSGPGIPEEEHDKIFQPFYRLNPGRLGSGLGLNLVQQIMNRHQGRVSVTNLPEGGARFTLTLPMSNSV